jgi:hypothetical protein
MIEYAALAVIRALSRCVGRLTLDNAPQISERISRAACRVAVTFLPDDAKEAFRNEVLNHLLELGWDDFKRGVDPEMMVSRAALRALALLFHAPGLRNDYRIIAPDAGRNWIWIARLVGAYVMFPAFYYRWKWRHRDEHRGVNLRLAFSIVAWFLITVFPAVRSTPVGSTSPEWAILAVTFGLAGILVGIPYLIGAIDLYEWWRRDHRMEEA